MKGLLQKEPQCSLYGKSVFCSLTVLHTTAYCSASLIDLKTNLAIEALINHCECELASFSHSESIDIVPYQFHHLLENAAAYLIML